MATPISRSDAMRVIRTDRRRTLRLLDRLSPRSLATPGLGGGDWSPKDLVNHLESWEQHALDALEAWSEGRPTPSARRVRTSGLNAVNREEVERRAHRSFTQALASANATHERLVAAIRATTDAEWAEPATSRARQPLGDALGAILGGPDGPFRHDVAHLPDLQAFVRDRSSAKGSVKPRS